MDSRFSKYVKSVGAIAFSWRLILTTGTGSIFGFLVARDAYDTAIMAPLFIAHSLAIGTAIFILIASISCSLNEVRISTDLIRRFGRLLLWFVLAVAYMMTIHHLTNLYISGHFKITTFWKFSGFQDLLFLLQKNRIFSTIPWYYGIHKDLQNSGNCVNVKYPSIFQNFRK